MDVMQVPCTIMRGGTSKAVFFRSPDIPPAGSERDSIILGVMGSGDPRQVDGLGGADVLTSKVAIVGPTDHPGADVDYTFGQVGIERRVIDWSLNCGNISAAAGVYAIEEGLVSPVAPMTLVRVHNTNTGKVLVLRVPVAEGSPLVDGDFRINGVPGTGAEIEMDFSDTVGAMTGSLFPTGSPADDLHVPELGRTIRVSVLDLANAAVYFHAADVGLHGTEGPTEFTAEVLGWFEAIQRAAAAISGIPPEHGFPRPIAVAEPQDFVDYMSGVTIPADSVELLGRRVILPPPRLHKAFAATGAVCTGVAARLKGTVVHNVVVAPADDVVRIGHPTGVFPVRTRVVEGRVELAAFSRTARRLMDGEAMVRSGVPA